MKRLDSILFPGGFRLRTALSAPVAALLCALLVTRAVEARETAYRGEGALQFGQIVHGDTSRQNYDGNFMRSSYAQLSVNTRFNEQLELNAGMGVLERHFLDGQIGNNGNRNPILVNPYIVQASFTYSFWNREASALRVTGGFFPYNYNPDVKNLGLYLLRGPVYPGFVISGFETKHVLPLATILGARVQHKSGAFEQNFILASETEYYPLFDLSPAYLASYSFGRLLRVGAGINLHHYIAIEPKITSPKTVSANTYPGNADWDDRGPYYRNNIYVDFSDTAGGRAPDTSYMSFRGTKIMANAALDIKEIFGGVAVMGPEDLKLYGEVAIIGLDRSEAYNALYGDLLHRMPVMVGFNVPTFGLLDHLSFETEWYGAPFKDDLERYQSRTSASYSPIPVASPANHRRDDWKWSLHASRTLAAHVRLSAQVANDHMRPGGTLTSPPAEWQSISSAPKHWYWMSKIAYFF